MPVRVGGPAKGDAVLLIPGADDSPDVWDAVAERLHNSELRTVSIDSVAGLTDADVLAVLDELSIPWVNLVGNREGADIAWSLAARTFGRVVSLVAIDSGHPGAECPPVEVRTTVVVADPAMQAAANASSRWVYGDFRIVTLDSCASAPLDAAPSVATEIVMRTSAW
ncbi:alpha/beta hydrolase [Rhodococcoides trifolii]|uniref:Alpha/beta hydrolase n=1 Tax=Rhodococcoides trifolii TaxID=908250 RepID=A0A917D1N9_9NOCA|nr:alpha/beta hydrolase [Rhodococcus trifolii]